jgi:hypothetical protein
VRPFRPQAGRMSRIDEWATGYQHAKRPRGLLTNEVAILWGWVTGGANMTVFDPDLFYQKTIEVCCR